MPKVRKIPGPYRFYFTSFDCAEPPHVHIESGKKTCKIWLSPPRVARSHGFSPRELGRILRLASEHREAILEAWREHCGSD